MAAINIKRPVRFYDDRGKEKTMFLLKEILFEDDNVCLCVIGLEKDTGDQILDKHLKAKVLFEIKTGKVLTENFMFWIAENYETEQVILAKKAIECVKNCYCEGNHGEYMLLGDVAELITLLTGVKVEYEELLLPR